MTSISLLYLKWNAANSVFLHINFNPSGLFYCPSNDADGFVADERCDDGCSGGGSGDLGL